MEQILAHYLLVAQYCSKDQAYKSCDLNLEKYIVAKTHAL